MNDPLDASVRTGVGGRILAADDVEFNLDLLAAAFDNLEPPMDLIRARDGAQALKRLQSDPDVDLVLLDIAMPEMSGLEVLSRMRADDALKHIPVIVITSSADEKKHALSLGANDFLAKPFDLEEVRLRAINCIGLKRYGDLLRNMNVVLEERVQERTEALRRAVSFAKETEYEISLRLGRASEYRDMETGAHIVRMSRHCHALGQLCGLGESEVELLLHAAPLHDLGKLGIPDAILQKPGKLTTEEFDVMKRHSIIGAQILEGAERFPVLHAAKIIALQHHEKWDGSGYPAGLKGAGIHVYGRIVAIADVFDALTSRRCYKPAFPLDKAIAIMNEGAGKHFDPRILSLFVNHLDIFVGIRADVPDE